MSVLMEELQDLLTAHAVDEGGDAWVIKVNVVMVRVTATYPTAHVGPAGAFTAASNLVDQILALGCMLANANTISASAHYEHDDDVLRRAQHCVSSPEDQPTSSLTRPHGSARLESQEAGVVDSRLRGESVTRYGLAAHCDHAHAPCLPLLRTRERPQLQPGGASAGVRTTKAMSLDLQRGTLTRLRFQSGLLKIRPAALTRSSTLFPPARGNHSELVRGVRPRTPELPDRFY